MGSKDKVKELESRIYKARMKRDALARDISSLRASIKWYESKGKYGIALQLKQKLRSLMPAYEHLKKEVSKLCEEWRKARREVKSDV